MRRACVVGDTWFRMIFLAADAGADADTNTNAGFLRHEALNTITLKGNYKYIQGWLVETIRNQITY